MNDKFDNLLDNAIGILIGAFAFIVVKSIFEDDSSKIISKKGRSILSNENQMKSINSKLSELENEDQYKEIYIEHSA